MAAIACAWLRKNVFRVCDGDPPRTMYFDTVDWATSKPSINSSPWIRDAPHFGFSLLIRPDQRAKVRVDVRPASKGAGFPPPVPAEPGPVPAHEGFGADNRDGLEDRRKPSIQLNEKQTVTFLSRTRPRTFRRNMRS